MLIAVRVLVLLDRVVACSATARQAEKRSRQPLCNAGSGFNKLVLLGSSC